MTVPPPAADIKVGELLTESKICASGDIVEAIQIAKRMNMPIGRVLIMSGCLKEDHLADALDAQTLIRQGSLVVETAIEALKMSFEKKIRLKEALEKLNWSPTGGAPTSRLGELLIDSNIVTEDELDKALRASFASGIPLGSTLVLQGLLSAQLLPTVLHLQDELKVGKVSREDAVENLKTAFVYWVSAEQSKVGEMLAGATGTGMQALSASQTQTSGAPPQVPTAPAQTPQAPQQAPAPAPAQAQALPNQSQPSVSSPAKRPSSTHQNIPVARPNTTTAPSVRELMQMSGFFSGKDLTEKLNGALAHNATFTRLAVLIGLTDQQAIEQTVRCHSMIASGRLTEQQAITALKTWKQHKLPLDQTFKQMNVT